VIDGKITDIDVSKVDPSTVSTVNVLNREAAIKKYGDKGKNGVLEMISKTEEEKDMMVAIEEMPQFPDGSDALMTWIGTNVKYPPEAAKKGIMGQVMVNFLVDSEGKIKDVKVDKSINPLLDAEAIRVISSMPDWKPGSQQGKKVGVIMKIPVNFTLK
jgi:TonB family protein